MDLSPCILEICKPSRQKLVYKNLSPAIIDDLFYVRQNNYNLRHNSYFVIPNAKSVYLGPRIWNLLLDKLKQLVDIHAFNIEIKKWKPKN